VITILPDEVVQAGSVVEAAERLGALLGLEGAAPLAATRRALNDPRYIRALWSSRKLPELRAEVLAAAVPSSRAVAAKAAGGILKCKRCRRPMTASA